jgi:ferredoxin-NADP reductase
MAQALDNQGTDFHLHYAGRSHHEMAFRDRLEHQFGNRLSLYSGADGERLDIAATLSSATDVTVIYVCGPKRLISAVTNAVRELGIARERVRLELFE